MWLGGIFVTTSPIYAQWFEDSLLTHVCRLSTHYKVAELGKKHTIHYVMYNALCNCQCQLAAHVRRMKRTTCPVALVNKHFTCQQQINAPLYYHIMAHGQCLGQNTWILHTKGLTAYCCWTEMDSTCADTTYGGFILAKNQCTAKLH